MRVAFVSHSSDLCGAEKAMLNLAFAMAKAGDAECLILTSVPGPMLSLAMPRGCQARRLRGRIPMYVRGWPWSDPVADQLRDSGETEREVTGILRDWGADLLVINTLTNVVGLLAAARLNLPCVTWIHGILDTSVMAQGAPVFKAACDEALLRGSAGVVAPSRWTAEWFERFLGVPVTLIPNATEIPEELPPWPSGVATFSCLNTLDTHKGMGTLIDAALILREMGYEFALNFHGDGTIREELKGRVAALGLEEFVRFRGRTTDVSGVYGASHALVTASEIEPFGMTLIEAMGHARPVIVSDTSGHREIVDGPFGVLGPPLSAEWFAWAMARVIDQPEEARRMGLLGREVALERYPLEALRRRFVALFSEILERERASNPATVVHRYSACRTLMALTG